MTMIRFSANIKYSERVFNVGKKVYIGTYIKLCCFIYIIHDYSCKTELHVKEILLNWTLNVKSTFS